MAKTLIINEKQYKKLFTEALGEGFRLDMLRGKSFAFKKRYTEQYLGKPIGRGSSRFVYQIDDYAVLKLAVSDAGIAQNKSEAELLKNNWLDIVPNLLNGSDEENYEWIITEYVLPANTADFKHIVGVPFKVVKDFCFETDRSQGRSIYADSSYKKLCQMYDEYADNEELIELFNDISSYQVDYERCSGDLTVLRNWGIVNRRNGPVLVVLDAGLTKEIFDTYYRKY